jgi:hypothetical protein
MPRGGARPNSGPKPKPKAPEVKDKDFAARVLARIGKPGWRILNIDDVKSDEDYAIWLISGAQGGNYFERYREKRDGTPVKTLNHVHDKPIEMNVTHSLAEIVSKARKRASN